MKSVFLIWRKEKEQNFSGDVRRKNTKESRQNAVGRCFGNRFSEWTESLWSVDASDGTVSSYDETERFSKSLHDISCRKVYGICTDGGRSFFLIFSSRFTGWWNSPKRDPFDFCCVCSGSVHFEFPGLFLCGKRGIWQNKGTVAKKAERMESSQNRRIERGAGTIPDTGRICTWRDNFSRGILLYRTDLSGINSLSDKENSAGGIRNYLYLAVYTAALCVPQLLLILIIQRARSMAGASKLTLKGMPVVKLIYGILFLIFAGMLLLL